MLDYIQKSPHRISLEKLLTKFAPRIRGEVLDIGSKNRRYDKLFSAKITAADIEENIPKNVIKADINKLPFKNESFDSVLCLEVFEYLKDPQKAMSEVYRVLKDKGTLIATFPFMYKFHYDQLRYSETFIKEELLKEFKSYEIKAIGNYFSIILDILRDKIIFIKFRLVRFLLYFPYLALTALLPLIIKLSKDNKHISGYFVIATK